MLETLPADALAFRTEVRTFLAESLDRELRAAARLTTGLYSRAEAVRRWIRILAARGWSAPSWPRAWGGPGWSAIERHIFSVECARAGAPLVFNLGERHIGPMLMAEGTEEQRLRFLPAVLSGDHVWCQGYSEPGAGSDLASLKLSAVRDGDDYVLNGTKIWTTAAHLATHMFCLVRTAHTGRKQEGISFLLLEMGSPGVEVRPIVSISGDHELNQVFFEDVRVPVVNRVGAENDGWRVTKSLMQHARSSNVNTGWVRELLARVQRIAACEPNGAGARLCEDTDFRRRLSATEIQLEAVETLELRVLAATVQGENPGAISSVLKTLGTELKQRITELGAGAAAWYGLPFQPAALEPGFVGSRIGPESTLTAVPSYLNERAGTIYSGASEVQRDVLAKRVLGL